MKPPTRTEMLDGREYLVVPTTIIVAGVLNGELVPVEEIAANVGGWNGRPIPVRHPQNAAGDYISANAPDVIERQVVGQLFNARFDTDRLRAEMWLDVAKVNSLGGLALDALKRIQAGDVVEVSTGYFAQVEETPGEYNGQPYMAIQHNLIPDHIALLPNEIGACSIEDGCGANRTNAMKTNAAQTQDPATQAAQGVMVAFYLKDADANALALDAGSLPDGSTVLKARDLHVTLAYLGNTEDTQAEFDRVASTLAALASGQALIVVSTSGAGRFTADPSQDMEPFFLLVESDRLHEFRRWLCEVLSWEVPDGISRENSFIPHITLGYVPKASPVELSPVTPRQLVFDQLALSWGDQTVLFDLQGELRANAAAHCGCTQEILSMDKEQKQAAVVKANDEEVTTPVATEETEVQPAALPADVLALSEAIKGFGGVAALLDAIKGIKANADKEKNALVSKLAANAQCAFSADELTAMPYEALQKIDRMLTPANYAGQGGAALQANTNDWVAYEAPEPKEAK